MVYTISTRAYTRTQARGATPELRRVAEPHPTACPQAGIPHKTTIYVALVLVCVWPTKRQKGCSYEYEYAMMW